MDKKLKTSLLVGAVALVVGGGSYFSYQYLVAEEATDQTEAADDKKESGSEAQPEANTGEQDNVEIEGETGELEEVPYVKNLTIEDPYTGETNQYEVSFSGESGLKVEEEDYGIEVTGDGYVFYIGIAYGEESTLIQSEADLAGVDSVEASNLGVWYFDGSTIKTPVRLDFAEPVYPGYHSVYTSSYEEGEESCSMWDSREPFFACTTLAVSVEHNSLDVRCEADGDSEIGKCDTIFGNIRFEKI